MKVTLRPYRKTDAKGFLGLVRDLARFEKLKPPTAAAERRLLRDVGKRFKVLDCHMPSSNYMVIDARRDHSFRIPRPGLSVATAAPNACTNCHSEQTDAWAVAVIDNWYAKSPGSEPHANPLSTLPSAD